MTDDVLATAVADPVAGFDRLVEASRGQVTAEQAADRAVFLRRRAMLAPLQEALAAALAARRAVTEGGGEMAVSGPLTEAWSRGRGGYAAGGRVAVTVVSRSGGKTYSAAYVEARVVDPDDLQVWFDKAEVHGARGDGDRIVVERGSGPRRTAWLFESWPAALAKVVDLMVRDGVRFEPRS